MRKPAGECCGVPDCSGLTGGTGTGTGTGTGGTGTGTGTGTGGTGTGTGSTGTGPGTGGTGTATGTGNTGTQTGMFISFNVSSRSMCHLNAPYVVKQTAISDSKFSICAVRNIAMVHVA